MKQVKFRIIEAFLLSAAITAACSKKEEKPDITPPVLSETPVEITSVTSFIPFGADLSAVQKNPAFEYRLTSAEVQVRSVCSGYIDRIMMNDNFPDYEIWVKTSSNSIWKIIYDHVLNLKVTKDQKLSPGDILGDVGTGNRTELQINKSISHNKELSYCPFDFATNDFINKHKAFTGIWCLTDTVNP